MYWVRSILALGCLCTASFAAATTKGGVSQKGSVCTVTALGSNQDDVPNILEAFTRCGKDGTIVFPEDQNYWIATKLNPILNNVVIEWRGVWTFSDDLDYWRNNSYPITFQNHHAGFIITGDRVTIEGYGTGGINGNGNSWYNVEQNVTQPGRPMPFVFWNVSEVLVEDFTVKDPPLWSLNIMNGTNMQFNNITCNATAVNAPYGDNWVQNTDGFDTMDVHNVVLNGFTYQGGDDCIAIKPRSYNVRATDITCHGGNGIAIGSLGQYLVDASVANVVVDNVTIIRRNNDMHNSAYIKTYMGGLVPQSSYESAGQPNGGGWGSVENILFSNFDIQGASAGPTITQDTGDNGSYPGTSLMSISNVAFVNFTGYLYGVTTDRIASVSCSNVHPCYNIDFQNVDIHPSQNVSTNGNVSCAYVATDGVHGLPGCS